MPVGFVSAGRIEGPADDHRRRTVVAIKGRKGGSTLVVAAIHALLGLAEAEQKRWQTVKNCLHPPQPREERQVTQRKSWKHKM